MFENNSYWNIVQVLVENMVSIVLMLLAEKGKPFTDSFAHLLCLGDHLLVVRCSLKPWSQPGVVHVSHVLHRGQVSKDIELPAGITVRNIMLGKINVVIPLVRLPGHCFQHYKM